MANIKTMLYRRELEPLLDRALAEITRDDIESLIMGTVAGIKARAEQRLAGRVQLPGSSSTGRGVLANRMLQRAVLSLQVGRRASQRARSPAQGPQPRIRLAFAAATREHA